MKTALVNRRNLPLALMAGFLILGAGCKNPFARRPRQHQRSPRQPPRPLLPLRATTSRLAVTFNPRSTPSLL